MMQLPAKVHVTEVGPRDGLQNEARFMPTAEKIRLIEMLARTGVTEIEITSFTNPKWIPNLADAAEVVEATRALGVDMLALIPNRRGLDRAVAAGIEGVTLVFSASDSHNRRNLNRSTEESLAECIELHRDAAFGCCAYLISGDACGGP
jgi:hydroxymethylglutaryl-CoA lyase